MTLAYETHMFCASHKIHVGLKHMFKKNQQLKMKES